MNPWAKRGVVLVAFAAATALGVFVAFEVALWVVPNRTPEGYGLMPIGQAGFALLAGPLVGVAAAVLVRRRLQR